MVDSVGTGRTGQLNASGASIHVSRDGERKPMEDDGPPLPGRLRRRSSVQAAVVGDGPDARWIHVDVRIVDVGEEDQVGLGRVY